ncbi:mitochondrial import receptor subunit tom20, partial [Massospora cicadina]
NQLPEKIKKFYATATKNFEVGDVIYTEKPLASTLVPSLEGKWFCSVCLKRIEESVKHPYLENVYCSQACYKIAKPEFPSERLTKGSLDLLTHFKESGKMLAFMMGRLFFKAFHQHKSNPITNTEPENFTAMQHAEYLASLDHTPDSDSCETEVKLMQEYLRHHIEDTEDADVISCPKTDERIRYVVPGPFTGCGYYPLSAYLNSELAEANCRVEFRNNDYELSLVATKPIKKGDMLTLLTFDASTAEPKAVEKSAITAGTDFPPLVSEGSAEMVDTSKPSDVAVETSVPSYAKVVSEPPELASNQKPAESSDVPSYAQVARDDVSVLKVDEKLEDSDKMEDLETSSEAEFTQASSYADIAAEPPAKDSDVIYPDEVTSSQEFEKVEASESP